MDGLVKVRLAGKDNALRTLYQLTPAIPVLRYLHCGFPSSMLHFQQFLHHNSVGYLCHLTFEKRDWCSINGGCAVFSWVSLVIVIGGRGSCVYCDGDGDGDENNSSYSPCLR